ncbi:MAG: hypothetical protein IPJ74_06065 [Saprospiraceae bacterium]|nr:hypothetical protein [Saprospiraceae bacterium]
MKYSIKLQDFPSFQFFAGAKEFMEKFKAYELEYSYYLFDLKEEIWKEAEKTLESSQLQFSKSYEVELSLPEMATYPAFNLVIPSIYDILMMGVNGSKIINSEELKETPLAVDFGTNIKILKKSVVEIIERLGVKLDFIDSINVKNERYFLINDFQELKTP